MGLLQRRKRNCATARRRIYREVRVLGEDRNRLTVLGKLEAREMKDWFMGHLLFLSLFTGVGGWEGLQSLHYDILRHWH